MTQNLQDRKQLDYTVLESWLVAYCQGEEPARKVQREARKIGYRVDLRHGGHVIDAWPLDGGPAMPIYV